MRLAVSHTMIQCLGCVLSNPSSVGLDPSRALTGSFVLGRVKMPGLKGQIEKPVLADRGAANDPGFGFWHPAICEPDCERAAPLPSLMATSTRSRWSQLMSRTRTSRPQRGFSRLWCTWFDLGLREETFVCHLRMGTS